MTFPITVLYISSGTSSALNILFNPSVSTRTAELNGRTLKEKSNNADVFWLQSRLKELGYYNTKCTGQMLNRTVAALKQFQRDYGLYPSGTADQKVIDALYEAATPAPRPTPTPYVSQ